MEVDNKDELTLALKETKLSPPSSIENFHFPFEPYQIQIDFMKEIFTSIEERKLAIFESPTGTGKSLSLLCGTITWLLMKDKERLSDLKKLITNFDYEKEEKSAKGATDWIKAFHNFNKKKEVIDKAKRELIFLESVKEKQEKILQKRKIQEPKNYQNFKKKEPLDISKSLGLEANKDKDEFDNFIIEEEFALTYNSDEEDESGDEEEKETEFYSNRIIIASRTHSQLSQFIKEIKRTSYSKTVTVSCIGSRQNLCINSEVTKLKSLSLMNERCLDLKKSSKGKTASKGKKIKTSCGGCPYYNTKGIEELKNHILSEPMDIEDLISSAKNKFEACPYYASRKASTESQITLLPYNSILHENTREGIGLKLQNSVIILDEAHNLIESIANMYSTQISQTQVEDSLAGFEVYYNRYLARFNQQNLSKLNQLRAILKNLVNFFESSNTSQNPVFLIYEMKKTLEIDTIDLYALIKYCQKSRLIFKLKGYLQHKIGQDQKSELENEGKESGKKENAGSGLIANKEKKKQQQKPLKLVKKKENTPKKPATKSPSSQSFTFVYEFLKSLLTFTSDGKIILINLNLGDGNVKILKFLLLSPSRHFNFLIENSRSIVLAGGTMKPYSDIEDQLFQISRKDRFHTFSCNHVIPKENIVCLALQTGPSNVQFDFTYKIRNSPHMMKELSNTIINLSRIVPDGLVIFLPSYEFERIFYEYLEKNEVLNKIKEKKEVYREKKDTSIDAILKEYSNSILEPNKEKKTKGALLFAVVGGKLSEGINFSDGLGRCIVVVGLPYPNITSIDIKEKLNFIEKNHGIERRKKFLENMCSKAVNQSIGRSIRHSNDYAAIVLIDNRYCRESQKNLLPTWIQDKYSVCSKFGQTIQSLVKFYNSKNK